MALLTSKRKTRLNGNGVALLNFGGTTDALFGLALAPDLTKAVAVGSKGVPTTKSTSTNHDDARIIRVPLPTGL